MVKCCRTPAIARELFTANALSGWPSGVSYTPRQSSRRERRRRLLLAALRDERKPAQPVAAVTVLR